jgi:adenylate cyclase
LVRVAVRSKVNARFDDQGEQTVKNIPEPERAFRVRPAGSGETQTPSTPAEATHPLADKPSIAVLPFTNMSGDAEQDYFADGITEDVTELARFQAICVIARNSCSL